MTTLTGTHVHPIGYPDLDLTIDVVAPQGSATAWYVAHDPDGALHYIPADKTEPHQPDRPGRHRAEDRPGRIEHGGRHRAPITGDPSLRWPVAHGELLGALSTYDSGTNGVVS